LSPLVNATGTVWFGQASIATSGLHHEAAHTGAERCLVVPLFREGVFIDIVEGDPTKPGVPYVMRIGNADGYIVFPHWHPEDEHVTVVLGTWHLGSGEKFDRNRLEEMPVGTYGVAPKRMPHFAWSRGETIIQIHGMGPFAQNFMEPPVHITANASEFKFRMGQKVLSEKGIGVIADALKSPKQNLTQYEIQIDGHGHFWSVEESLRAI